MIIAGCFLVFNSQGQVIALPPTQTNIPACFCCEGFYKLPTAPPIDGPKTIHCNKAEYTTPKCRGASYRWEVSPAVSFSGQGTNTITLNPPFNSPQYKITLTLMCGSKTVTRTLIVRVTRPPVCKADFTFQLEKMPNGRYKARTTSQSTGTGYGHLWIIYEKPSCSSIDVDVFKFLKISSTGALTKSDPTITAPGGYGFQYSGLIRGKTYMLYHAVHCCGQSKILTKCFRVPTSGLWPMNEQQLKPSIMTDSLHEDNLPEQVKRIRDSIDNK